VIGPDFHALDVNIVAAAELAVCDGQLFGEELILADRADVVLCDRSLFQLDGTVGAGRVCFLF